LVEKLYVVLSSSPNRDKELCERDGIKYIPHDIRLSWLGEAFNDLDNIEILHVEDEDWDNDYNWQEGAKLITNAIPEKITHVFSSEPEYADHFNKWYPFAKHILVDDKRKTVTISATELRRNLYDNWDKLPNYVQKHFVKKIVLVGTESVGKTTLCKKLSKLYNTNMVPEVGRSYCERYKNMLTAKMFVDIAMEHYLLIEKSLRTSDKMIFIDSDAIITGYYLKMYRNLNSFWSSEESEFIDKIIKMQDFDMVLYLEKDVKWVPDGFRFEGTDEQREANEKYLKWLYENYDINPIYINGTYSERFKKARTEVNKLFGWE
jgi:HTH-type transcriptional repressor of NAD biosynthesis genes